jgi:hypothetical protein
MRARRIEDFWRLLGSHQYSQRQGLGWQEYLTIAIGFWGCDIFFERTRTFALSLFSAADPDSIASREPVWLLLSLGLLFVFAGILVSSLHAFLPPTQIEKYWWLCFPVFWSISFLIEKIKHGDLGFLESYHDRFLYLPFVVLAYRFDRLTGIIAPLLVMIGLTVISFICPFYAVLEAAYHLRLIGEYLILSPEIKHDWVLSLNIIADKFAMMVVALDALVALNVTGRLLTPFRQLASKEPGMIDKLRSNSNPSVILLFGVLWFSLLGQSRILGEFPLAWLGIDLVSKSVGQLFLLALVIVIHWIISNRSMSVRNR